MNIYEVIGVFYYTKEGQEKTLVHYLKPLKNGEGFSGEKLFLEGSLDVKKGDQIKLIFDLNYNGKPYITGVEVVD